MAVVGLGVCAVLLTARSGHPPGVVFLPHVIVAWLLTHAFLGLVQGLAAKGRARMERNDAEAGPWPILLVVIAAVFSLAFLYMSAGLGAWLLSGEAWTTRRLVYLALQLAALVGLCGILLRMHWGRMVAAAACLLLAAYMLFKAIVVVIAGDGLGFGGLLYALLLVGGLAVAGRQLLISQRIRSFFT